MSGISRESLHFSLGNLLEAHVALRARTVLWTAACLLPLVFLLRHFSPRTGFEELLFFGEQYFSRAIPQVQALHPPVETKAGYDAQFYAQLALDPLLQAPALKTALDMPAYRARRIGMPWLAYLVGWGKPYWILQSFALLNIVFWYLLLFGMCRFLRPQTWRDHLCIAAACLTSGAMFSIQRALLDLPAATVALYGASLRTGAAPAFAAAILTKETFALSLFGLPVPRIGESHRGLRFAILMCIALAPAVGWYFYVHSVFNWADRPPNDFAWPFAGYIAAIGNGIAALRAHRTIFSATQFLAPLSLLVQLVWLLGARRVSCRYWRIGAAFGVATAFMSREPFVEQISYCRDTLAMTLAFNIGLMRSEPRRFLAWFVAGNVGLTWGLLSLLTR